MEDILSVDMKQFIKSLNAEIHYEGWLVDFPNSVLREKWIGGYLHSNVGPAFVPYEKHTSTKFYLKGKLIGYYYINSNSLQIEYFDEEGNQFSLKSFNDFLKIKGINYVCQQ